MPEIKEKLATYAGYIVSQAEAEAEAARAETSEAEAKALAEAEAKAAGEAKLHIAADAAAAKAKADKRIVAATMKNRRRLLEYRERCAADVFAEVRKRVDIYTASKAYAGELRKLLQKAAGALPGISSAQVFLRGRDMALARELADALPGVKLSFSEGRFALGGLMLQSAEKARRVDLTYDSAFTDLSGRFSEITGFRVEG